MKQELFVKHINNIDKRYNEIFAALNEYIARDFSTLSEDFLNYKISTVGEKLEQLLEDVEPDDCSEADNDSESGLFPFDVTDIMDNGHN